MCRDRPTAGAFLPITPTHLPPLYKRYAVPSGQNTEPSSSSPSPSFTQLIIPHIFVSMAARRAASILLIAVLALSSTFVFADEETVKVNFFFKYYFCTFEHLFKHSVILSLFYAHYYFRVFCVPNH